jgi:tetratricopeptide (TPR) repeat protein
MSDPLRTDGSRVSAAASEADRDAKIEQLLLAGLDHYFAAQYDHAISVWTRVLFLDRNHARARAYVERARSALAERQRQSEELLQNGVAAFQRGDGGEARRLVQAAIDGGAPADEALAVLDRMNRFDTSTAAHAPSRARGVHRETAPTAAELPATLSGRSIVLMFVLVLAGAGIYSATLWGPLEWRTLFPPQSPPVRIVGTPPREPGLALPRRGELLLTRARALAADGHLRDALATLDRVQLSDPQKPDADRLRGELQLQLLALTSVPAQPPGERAAADAAGSRPGR